MANLNPATEFTIVSQLCQRPAVSAEKNSAVREKTHLLPTFYNDCKDKNKATSCMLYSVHVLD